MHQKVRKHSADLQINVPSSVFFYLSHVRSLAQICVTNLSNCEIWLQIKPNLDVNLSLDAGESEIMLEIQNDFLQFCRQTKYGTNQMRTLFQLQPSTCSRTVCNTFVSSRFYTDTQCSPSLKASSGGSQSSSWCGCASNSPGNS